MMTNVNDIKTGVLKGDFLQLARTLTAIENNRSEATAYLETIHPERIPIIGITGPPGAGKSTLIAALIKEWVGQQKKIAVLSVDPSSPFHKGAILGDRVRMKDWYLNPNVFIRSLASRGHLGGLTASMIELTTLLQSVGFDYILLETVGVGQSEVEVAALADITLVVLVPESGDEVQMMKAGLMEVADCFVVNKSDRPDAELFANHIRQMIAETDRPEEVPDVFCTIASQQEGTAALAQAMTALMAKPRFKQKHQQLLVTKVCQLIINYQLRKMDVDEIAKRLSVEKEDAAFNIFKFAKSFL